jgi:hypothetical protein
MEWKEATADGIIDMEESARIQTTATKLGSELAPRIQDAVGYFNDFSTRVGEGTGELEALRDTILPIVNDSPYEIWFDLKIRGGLPDVGGGGGGDWQPTTTPTAAESGNTGNEDSGTGVQRQGGGFLARNGWTLVGDPGPQEELISPQGWVFDARTTKALMAAGVAPDLRRGVEIGGGGSPDYGPIDPEDTGGAMSLGGYIPPTSTTTYSPSSGGGGTTTTSSPIIDTVVTQTSQAIEAAVESVAEDTAVAVSAAVAPIIAQQAQQQASQQARLSEQNQQQIGLLRDLVSAVRELGTSDETGQAVQEAIQFADF